MRFSPDGKTAAHQRLRQHGPAVGPRHRQRAAGARRPLWWVWAAEFSPDGKRIVTAGQDGKAIVWQRPVGADAGGRLRAAHRSSPSIAAPSTRRGSRRDDGTVATAGFDGRVLLWDPDEVQPIDVELRIDESCPTRRRRFANWPAIAARCGRWRSAPDGATLASGGQDNVIIVLGRRRRGERRRSCAATPATSAVVAFSPDGALLLVGGPRSADQTVAARQRTARRASSPPISTTGYADARGAVLAPTASAWSPPAATARRRCGTPASLERIQRFQEGHDFLASSAVFFADGTRLATGAGDGTVRIWDVATGAEILRLDGTGRTGAARRVGRRLAHRHRRPRRRRRSDLGRRHAASRSPTLAGHDAEVTAVRFAPGGELLATGDDHGHCRLWRYDAATSKWIGRRAGSTATAARSRRWRSSTTAPG